MADYQQDTTKFPPGWDCKYDSNTGKCYYINYITKAMSLEDPRIRYRQLQNEKSSMESIPMQPVHGSPYHVYPANSYPAVQAFQGSSNTAIYNVSSSPLMTTNRHHNIEMSPLLRGSPHAPRIMSQLVKQQQQQQLQQSQTSVQETSFITPAETDAAVSKINTMFPTASDSHIRLLLKKYYNREAVVISALQVEKHPLTTPGPFSTPPPPRHNIAMGMNSLMSMTPPPMNRFEPIVAAGTRTSSPIPRPGSCASGSYGSPRVGEGYRCSPKPHSSPKMKLRYIKSIFPKAEETLILDVLANADNNVQIASEKLLSMGYEKREATAPRLTNRKREEKLAKELSSSTPPPQPKIKTNEEKNKIKLVLQSRYPDIPGRIITMALESVDFSEDKALKILQIVMQDDKSAPKTDTLEIKEDPCVENKTAPIKQSSQSRNNSITSSSAPPFQPSSTTNTTTNTNVTTTTTITNTNVATVTAINCNDSVSKLVQQDDAVCAAETNTPNISSSSSSSPETADESTNNGATISAFSSPSTAAVAASGGVQKKRNHRFKTKSDHTKSTPDEEVDTAAKKNDFQSIFTRVHTGGPNTELCHGPNENLLLADYIAWNGANPELCVGQKSLALGADSTLRNGRATVVPHGPNTDLYKGPTVGLAKGSIYAQINRQLANVKCN